MDKINKQFAADYADNKAYEIAINNNVSYPNYHSAKDLVECDEDNNIVYKSDVQKLYDYWYKFCCTEILGEI